MSALEELHAMNSMFQNIQGTKTNWNRALDHFKYHDDRGDLTEARKALLAYGNAIIEMKNSVANAIANNPNYITRFSALGITKQDIIDEISPLLTKAQWLIANYNSVTRSQIDAQSYEPVELVKDFYTDTDL